MTSMPLSLAGLANENGSADDSFEVIVLSLGRREMNTEFLERAKPNGESCLSFLTGFWVFGVLVVFARISAGVCDAKES